MGSLLSLFNTSRSGSGMEYSLHYCDVIMGANASQITSLTIVYSTVYSGADQRKIKAPRHWPLCGEFTGDRWIPRTNGQWRGKCFHLMTSSWKKQVSNMTADAVGQSYQNQKALNKKLIAECLVMIGWCWSISQSKPSILLKDSKCW